MAATLNIMNAVEGKRYNGVVTIMRTEPPKR